MLCSLADNQYDYEDYRLRERGTAPHQFLLVLIPVNFKRNISSGDFMFLVPESKMLRLCEYEYFSHDANISISKFKCF